MVVRICQGFASTETLCLPSIFRDPSKMQPLRWSPPRSINLYFLISSSPILAITQVTFLFIIYHKFAYIFLS